MSEERYDIDDLITQSKEELKEMFDDELDEEYYQDTISELADSNIPIHN